MPQTIHFNHPERSILDTMLYEKKGMTAQSARNRLAAYQFQGEDVFKPVSVLSGGELSRLRLCMLMDEEINLLILDEPTNHLDIAAREWIEEAVEAFDGTLLFVSHDRYFIQRFATRIWELADGTITDYPMGFAQYRAVKAQEKAPQPVKAPEKKGPGWRGYLLGRGGGTSGGGMRGDGGNFLNYKSSKNIILNFLKKLELL